jgi:hypothetical protein
MPEITRVVTVFVVAVALLLPGAGWAGPHTVFGSLTVLNASPAPDGSPLNPGDIAGLAIIANPGMEKTISEELPPYTVPIFVDVDEDNAQQIVKSRFDTTAVLTNTTGSQLSVLLIVRDAAGTTLGSETLTIPAHGTAVVMLSSLL